MRALAAHASPQIKSHSLGCSGESIKAQRVDMADRLSPAETSLPAARLQELCCERPDSPRRGRDATENSVEMSTKAATVKGQGHELHRPAAAACAAFSAVLRGRRPEK